MSYKIYRFFNRSRANHFKLIKEVKTLEEAQTHCNNPKTKKQGVWFDGYSKTYLYDGATLINKITKGLI